MAELVLGGWAGGLNTRDNPAHLKPDETPDALNVTLDDSGALEKRLGYVRRFVNPVGTGNVSNLFWWDNKGFLISQVGTGMHKDDGAAFHTWTTPARVGMCEFLGNLIMLHPVDGIRMYDGTTVTAAPANAPLGDTVATWQNRIWCAGNPTNPARVTFSDIAAFTFSVSGWVDLREKDTNKVVALAGAEGTDITGRPGLLAFKKDSVYRIHDSTTGAYTTVDSQTGAASNISVVSVYGRTYFSNKRGIFYTDGIAESIEVSNKIENFFFDDVISHTQDSLYAAGRHNDRLWFSFPAAGGTYNTKVIEHHPHNGWCMAHTNAASAYATIHGGAHLAIGSPNVAGRIYDFWQTGGDDGAAISSYFQTSWTAPGEGNRIRVRRARVFGYGNFSFGTLLDYSTTSVRGESIDITPETWLYDDPSSVYAASFGTREPGALYGPLKTQDSHDLWSVGTCRAFSFRISESSTLTSPGREVLNQSLAAKGAWTLSHIHCQIIPLGSV